MRCARVRRPLPAAGALVVALAVAGPAAAQTYGEFSVDRSDPEVQAVLRTEAAIGFETDALSPIPPDIYYSVMEPIGLESDVGTVRDAYANTTFNGTSRKNFRTSYPKYHLDLSCAWGGPADIVERQKPLFGGTRIVEPVDEATLAAAEIVEPSADGEEDFPVTLQVSIHGIPCELECLPSAFSGCTKRYLVETFRSVRFRLLQTGLNGEETPR